MVLAVRYTFWSFQVGQRKDCPVIVSAFRVFALVVALGLVGSVAVRAAPITIEFTARVGTANSIDSGNVFGEGYGANLAGQIIAGAATIDPAGLTSLCATGAACYGDFGAGAISVRFTLNGITSTTVSSGTLGYFGNASGGSVLICDPSDGGNNYLAVGATSADGMVQQSLGALFSVATLFSAHGGGDAGTAIDSLMAIGDGAGLAKGGITYMNPIEHLDAVIVSVDVPEPATLPLFGVAVLLLARVRREKVRSVVSA
jgi:hypothetical protein